MTLFTSTSTPNPAPSPLRTAAPPDSIRWMADLLGLFAVLFTGAIFGFFYAWVCSTMWGLDGIASTTAIEAMQAMNASVRNPVFGTVFFGTAPICLAAALAAHGARRRRASLLFVAATVLYAVGGVGLTLAYNVPLNTGLAAHTGPLDAETARTIWTDYSASWQMGNITRTAVSGAALLLTALAFGVRRVDAEVPA